MRKKQTNPTPDYTLTGPAGTGGITGGGGFDFQTRYILCRLAEWGKDPAFYQIWHEGTGDVDVRFNDGTSEWRDHIQVKDHPVTATEFNAVVTTFVGFETAMPGVYRHFVLAAPDMSAGLKPLYNAIQRLRGAQPFLDTKPEALATDRGKAVARIHTLGLSAFTDFILDRLQFDLNLHDCHDDLKSRTAFLGNMRYGDAEIWRKLVAASDNVYDRLFREVTARRAKALSSVELSDILTELSKQLVIQSASDLLASISVHNWSYEPQLTSDHELNWSEHFDRSTRQVPTPDAWETLVREVYALKKTLVVEKGPGVVRVAGSGCLTTQLAIGLVFRETEGWIIETLQRPANEMWRSDVAPALPYPVQVRDTPAESDADALALVVSIKNDAQRDVELFLDAADIQVKAIVNVLPPSGARSLAIASNAEATALATSIRDALRAAQDQYGVKTTHVFMSGPQSVALFLGQRLTSMGRLMLYEYQEPGYCLSCSLST